MSDIRYDVGQLRAPRRTPNGRLRVDAVFTRSGIFTYYNGGEPQRELRDDDEVFAPEALASLEVLPVVNDHPKSGLLGGDHTRAQGWTLEGVRRDGDLVIGSLVVTDPDLIKAIESGKRAVSVGYEVKYVPGAGEHPKYGKYHGRQTQIRGDHLAVVDAGRAGPEAQIRMDSAHVDGHAIPVPTRLTPPAQSITLIGKAPMDETKKLQEALADARARADAAEKGLREATARADAAQGEADTLKAEVQKLREQPRFDADVARLQAQVDNLNGQLAAAVQARKDAENPKRFTTAVLKRTKLEGAARAVLGDKFRADAGDRDLMLAVLEKLQGTVDRERSDEYIEARHDAAVEAFFVGEKSLSSLRTRRDEEAAAEARVDSRNAREKFLADRATIKPLSEI